jgi:DNA-binding transcriptional LysR family regulator
MENLDDMILLAEVADSRSFTKAGARLGIPKSTISQRIALLESRLGLRLLNRTTRRVSLTGNGQVFVDYCRRVRKEAEAAGVAMSNLKEQPTGSVRVTCPEVTASYLMPSFLKGFSKQFSQVAIELIATNENLNLVRDRIDFAFRVGTVSGQDLVVRKISTIKRVLVASPAYLASHEPATAPEQLAAHRCLVHASHATWQFSKGTTISKLSPAAVMKSDSIGFLLQAALAGSGIAILPAYVCAPSIALGSLTVLLPNWKIPAHQMVMVSPTVTNLSKAQAAFRKYTAGYDFSPLASGAGL